MAVTYKLVTAAASDGAIYIDLPVSGRLASVAFAGYLSAGAGGLGWWQIELSRVAVNQVAVSNPRGVIAGATLAAPAASQGAAINATQWPDEPVKSGERLYLNAASTANWAAGVVAAYVTIA